MGNVLQRDFYEGNNQIIDSLTNQMKILSSLAM